MDVFDLRDRLISDYSDYTRSFLNIRDQRIDDLVDSELQEGLLWPDPLIQLNPSFERGESIDDLVSQKVLHDDCSQIFRIQTPDDAAVPLRLHRHQSKAVKTARSSENYVLTTGTGSGKSLCYMIPIVDHTLRVGSGGGIKAIIVYPMNALANSQIGELEKFLGKEEGSSRPPVRFARYTGQESDEDRQRIISDPPDILLTNYVMLELLLTRPFEKQLIAAAKGLRFLVLDELHTYRGRQGADVGMLVRRVRNVLEARDLQCVGTSATVAGKGSAAEQQAEVGAIASVLFGDEVKPENVIGETLTRSTPELKFDDASVRERLRKRLTDGSAPATGDFSAFVDDPLSSWIETTFGLVSEPGSGRLIRATPISITGPEGAALSLAALAGIDEEAAEEAIQAQLLAGFNTPHPDTGFPVFAFRLHQFISRGDTVYCTLEPEDDRFSTVNGQQFVPGDRTRRLYALAFCRECGQEYYMVRRAPKFDGSGLTYEPRDFDDLRSNDGEGDAGYLFIETDPETRWPDSVEEVLERIPEDWLEHKDDAVTIKKSRRKSLPSYTRVDSVGGEEEDGVRVVWVPAPFRFCLRCGVAYSFIAYRKDYAKLGLLGSEGRSTATTILSMSAVKSLRADEALERRARKLLSFTDNRQDAALQAGHFNDFIEVSLLRGGLFDAVSSASGSGLTHEDLTQRVFTSLNLPLDEYATDPEVKFAALDDTRRALREVLGYRLYRDLKRGWRINCPNLEQTGLLRIGYRSLDELADAEEEWQGCHSALVSAAPETREAVCHVLLDFLRRELAIKVDYLQAENQDRIKQLSSQRLAGGWAVDENEVMETAQIAYPRSKRPGDYRGNVFLSERSGFGQYLRRKNTFPEFGDNITPDESYEIILQSLQVLRVAGLTTVVDEPTSADDVPGYQVPASAFVWQAGDGSTAFHDLIRVPRSAEAGGRTNEFFIDLYRSSASELTGLEAHEHTAQVDYETRQEREDAFREAELPILFCSPTMELGVDIAQLNVVSLRNVPPTPANYAQRSGRAGRSGQPALVFTYCSRGSSHDQYFFKRPSLMVAGAVSPPRLDLANEDLVRSHMHSLWLSETGVSLGTTLQEILDLTGDKPKLGLLPSVEQSIQDDQARARAASRCAAVLETVSDQLDDAEWFTSSWIEDVLNSAPLAFDKTADRWRGLFRAGREQQQLQNAIANNASKPAADRKRARRLRREAEAQLELLLDSRYVAQSDFYSYRYFASEGFLPGYNFPRLPLSAFIPGRRGRGRRDEFLSRPRFLAISEFGPRSIIYHEGARYLVNQVILPAESDDLRTAIAKVCNACGYLHPIAEGDGPDLCDACWAELGVPLRALFRLQNVSTVRRERINSDQEERVRLGYEISTAYRFAERDGTSACRVAQLRDENELLGTLTYGAAATLWRVNLGWSRRKNKNQKGFVLDTERGYWARNQDEAADDPEDSLSNQMERVIPYVEDRKNALIFELHEKPNPNVAASLQAALKNAIQVEFELEEFELAAEPLPSRDDRRRILFYESAEGGAGVLRRLIDDADAMPLVARRALEICHFDPDTGDDQRCAPGAREDCEAACYDCLMSYRNQMDHALLDRQRIRELLLQLADATVDSSSGPLTRGQLYEQLRKQAGSGLEKKWLEFLWDRSLRLPSHAQRLIPDCGTRPDFLYQDRFVSVYIDGPVHDHDDVALKDLQKEDCMRDLGYSVLRFRHDGDWEALVAQHPEVFGSPA